MKKILTVTAMIASLALASSPAKADGDDIVKILGAIMIFQQLFDNDNGHHNGGYQQGGYYGNGVYDDRGIYQRTCNDNLGCAAQDNNWHNDPRRYGYAQGRYSNGAPTGQVCGKRSYRLDHYTTRTDHLDCNGNIMFSTNHRR
jgi:hypothetical protein